MKQQAALPPGSPRDKGRPRAVWNVFKQFGSAVVGLLIIAYIGLQLALNVGDFVEVENAMQAYAEALISFVMRSRFMLPPAARAPISPLTAKRLRAGRTWPPSTARRVTHLRRSVYVS